METKIDISELSYRACRRAEAMAEAEERPVYARRRGRGYELTQIHFIIPYGDQYEKEEERLLKDGWKRIDFCW